MAFVVVTELNNMNYCLTFEQRLEQRSKGQEKGLTEEREKDKEIKEREGSVKMEISLRWKLVNLQANGDGPTFTMLFI